MKTEFVEEKDKNQHNFYNLSFHNKCEVELLCSQLIYRQTHGLEVLALFLEYKKIF